MENSFIGGSENLYKYLVTIGLLLIVGSVYYPLKEKQSLELLKIELQAEVKQLSVKVKSNAKAVEELKNKGMGNLDSVALLKTSELNEQNQIKQLETERKLSEISNRSWYIKLYNILFWCFFPIGIVLCTFGFIKWNKVKKCDDEIKTLELKKLKIEVNNLNKNKD
ncbi:hypothetical protein [Sphingobacterium cellulitidis]|uniref:hypothetical protein n=1 Tax=Sphingobacterium cellulitidis TaxID=1768011 RepID=UPI000B93EB59|nr:hypothetical protein CHT99_15505 [Sphingobacterium cellulitidis]